MAKRYCVDICRTEYETRMFEVEADDENDAREKAMQEAYDYYWDNPSGSECEIIGVKEDS